MTIIATTVLVLTILAAAAAIIFGAGRRDRGAHALGANNAHPARKPARTGQKATPAGALPRNEPAALERFMNLGLPIRCGGRRGRYVALTFDDGPGPYSGLALSILRRAHARATFFLVGKELRYWSSLPREELALAALGDHTWSHSYLPSLSSAAIAQDIASTRLALERETGVTVRLFRPPYGARDSLVDSEAHAQGLVEILWSIDSGDSEGARWYQIAANIRRAVRPGSIILMHENRGQTIRALFYRILPLLHRRGLLPVTVPELLALDPPTPGELRAGLSGCYPGGIPRAVTSAGGG